MENVCASCNRAKTIKKVPEYNYNLAGIPLRLFDAVTISQCDCNQEGCNESTEPDIPNHQGLVAAAATLRSVIPVKLCGTEIKFLRKAIELPAKRLAQLLDVTPETVSRWENDKAPISTSSEKLLRFLVATSLKEKAPILKIDIKTIAQMEISGFSQPDNPVQMSFTWVRYMRETDKELGEGYAEDKVA